MLQQDPDFDFSDLPLYERHAINGALDLEKADEINAELLAIAEKMQWLLSSEQNEWTSKEYEELDAAIRKARGE